MRVGKQLIPYSQILLQEHQHVHIVARQSCPLCIDNVTCCREKNVLPVNLLHRDSPGNGENLCSPNIT